MSRQVWGFNRRLTLAGHTTRVTPIWNSNLRGCVYVITIFSKKEGEEVEEVEEQTGSKKSTDRKSILK